MRYLSLALLFITSSVFAAGEIAVCNSPLTGYSYHPFDSASKPSTFTPDKVTNSKITVRITGTSSIDVLYTDSSQSIKSATQEGAKVVLLQVGSRDFTLGVFYPGSLTTIYIFSKKGDENTVAMHLARAGDEVKYPKSTLLVGSCELIVIPKS